MKSFNLTLCALGLFSVVLTGCDENKACQDFAAHLADVLVKESGETPKPEHKDKMIMKTAESCTKDPPKQDVLDCAMKAETSEAIKACDPKGDAEE